MDGAEGRHILSRLCTFYCLPYFGVGVKLEADGMGGMTQICGGINYLQPDGSSLLSRGGPWVGSSTSWTGTAETRREKRAENSVLVEHLFERRERPALRCILFVWRRHATSNKTARFDVHGDTVQFTGRRLFDVGLLWPTAA